PDCFYPQFQVTLGQPTRVSWSGKIDDPDDPTRLVNRLEATALGCAWMLDRWADLRELLEDGGQWQPPDRLRAIRRLGRQPLDVWEDRRVMAIYLACAAMGPPGVVEFGDVAHELHAGERRRFIERISERGAMLGPAMPADAEAGQAGLLAVGAGGEGRLGGLLGAHPGRGRAARDAPAVSPRPAR